MAVNGLLRAHTQFGPETALARHSLWPGNTSARNNFGPETTSAQKILRPGEYFGPENTSARCILWPGNNFGPIDFGPLHFGLRTKLSKVTFFIMFDLP
jgi:hypothetical protein